MQAAVGKDFAVGLGECRMGRYPESGLSAHALGSCIAVLAWDWKMQLGGLVHVMLPDSAADAERARLNPWVFADTSVPALLGELEKRGGARNRLRWCLAGGASMMVASSHFEIGKRNHLVLKKTFWKMGIFVDREDVGGAESRNVRLDLATGRIDLRRGAGPEQIFVPPSIMQITQKTQMNETAPISPVLGREGGVNAHSRR